jgi:hypothetical protein
VRPSRSCPGGGPCYFYRPGGHHRSNDGVKAIPQSTGIKAQDIAELTELVYQMREELRLMRMAFDAAGIRPLKVYKDPPPVLARPEPPLPSIDTSYPRLTNRKRREAVK